MRSIERLGCLVLALLFAAAPARAQDDLRDIVLTTKGDEVRGRILQRYDEKELVLLQGGRTIQISKTDVASIVHEVRAALRTFSKERRERLTLDEEWALVARADQLQLPRMADLQAWHVLTLDPRHEGANERLGHRRQGRIWKWKHGRRYVEPEEFAQRVREWKDRLVLESENYRLETNTNLKLAVNLLFDLERAYTAWLDKLGASLQAAEVPVDPAYRMKVLVFADTEENELPLWTGSEKVPFYGASLEQRTTKGEPNVLFTYLDGRDVRPAQFFELAAEQLLYTTLVFGRRTGNAPDTELQRFSYWAELGMGYWFGGQLGGPLGYAREKSFMSDPAVMRYARQDPGRRSPLAYGRKEVTNLIGLAFREFHGSDEERANIHRAKAKTFFAFLMVEDPPIVRKGTIVGSGREALMRYLHLVYATPRGHSSSAFDAALEPGRVEDLEEPWKRWLYGG